MFGNLFGKFSRHFRPHIAKKKACSKRFQTFSLGCRPKLCYSCVKSVALRNCPLSLASRSSSPKGGEPSSSCLPQSNGGKRGRLRPLLKEKNQTQTAEAFSKGTSLPLRNEQAMENLPAVSQALLLLCEGGGFAELPSQSRYRDPAPLKGMSSFGSHRPSIS